MDVILVFEKANSPKCTVYQRPRSGPPRIIKVTKKPLIGYSVEVGIATSTRTMAAAAAKALSEFDDDGKSDAGARRRWL